ncbi:MAG TPA: hypothetical protein VMC09_05500 [Anaerolineales bacterium]|nr:hypothetical protein [Anaerolineales bacterium]
MAEMKINGNSIPWLLGADSPGVRYLALRDLLDRPADDPELLEARRVAHRQGPIMAILSKMELDGFWSAPGPGYNPKYFSTVWSIIALAELGGRVEEDERIGQACAYLLDQALAKGGQFSISGSPSGTIDCLQGNLCWALLELGYEDPRLEAAFEWMARTVTGEGLAPTDERNAPLRYYAYKCGPNFACGANNQMSCAWGAAKVMLALSKWPAARRTPLIREAIDMGVDFLFSVDPATAGYPSGTTGKPSQSWFKFGFPVFYVTDVLQVVEALAAHGFAGDPRLKNAIEFIRGKQDGQGRWLLEYDYHDKTWTDFGAKGEPNPWVTLRALRALKAAA